MPNTLCAATIHWLAGDAARPSAELATHVAGCARCRGGLAATFASLVAPPPDDADSFSCALCEEDLPAYLDIERAQGAIEAARRHPQLWWHLMVCPECAEQARLTAALLNAAAAGDLAAPPRARGWATAGALPPLRLERSFLNHFFGARLALGTAWASAGSRTLIAEDDLPGYRLAIYVRQRDANVCDLEVGVEPPLAGAVVVRFGTASFRAPLDGGSLARLVGLPVALLTDRDGPDMVISVEPEPDDAEAR